MQRHADELGIFLRQVTPGVVHRGEFYGQTATGAPYPEGITAARLVELIRQAGVGMTEIACHPGTRDPQPWSVYSDEREQELAALCDSSVRAAVDDPAVICGSFYANSVWNAGSSRMFARSSSFSA
jgi:predicted glycoside hydrolase/deacetylase ChbG (UPF0249 family)